MDIDNVIKVLPPCVDIMKPYTCAHNVNSHICFYVRCVPYKRDYFSAINLTPMMKQVMQLSDVINFTSHVERINDQLLLAYQII